MANPICRIVDWNRDAGLLDKGYDDFLESSFQIEEALEGFPLYSLCDRLGKLHDDYASPKAMSRYIMEKTQGVSGVELSDVDRLDKACDAIVFAVGSMAKLGLTAEQIEEALNIVMDANRAKLGCPKDEYGKLAKPDNFPNPEPRLRELLDKRY